MSLADALRKANVISDDQLKRIKKEKERKRREEERKAYQERHRVKPLVDVEEEKNGKKST